MLFDTKLETLIDTNHYHNILSYINAATNLNCYAMDAVNSSVLYWAIFNHKGFDAIKALIDSNKDFYFPTTDGETPLMIAAQENRIDVVKLILQKNKKCLNLRDKKNQNALYFAVHYTDNNRVVDLLLKEGIHRTIKNIYGINALKMCKLKGHLNSENIIKNFSQMNHLQKTMHTNTATTNIKKIKI